MKLVLIYLVIALAGFSLQAQTNLVLNPGFELYSQCPQNPGDFGKVSKWFRSKGSCDYFNSCANINSNISIPVNSVGQQQSHTGEAYAGIFTYVTSYLWPAPTPPGNLSIYYFWDVTEFFGIKLKYSLTSGKRYNCGFYSSLGYSCYYATKSMGMLFAADSIALTSGPTDNDKYFFASYMIDTLDPQVRYTGNEFLSDRNGWTKIEGSFIADGTEQYLYIGNFDHNPLVDTLNVFDSTYHHLNPEFNWNYSYYYIDDVWVYEDTTVSVNEEPSANVGIYPNPARDFVSIELPPNYSQVSLNIYNLTGQLISQKQITQPNQNILITELGNGMYIFVIQNEDRVIGRERVVVGR